MIIRVSELDEQGLRIDDVAALAQGLSEPSWRLETASLEIEAEGSDVFVRGHELTVGGRTRTLTLDAVLTSGTMRIFLP